MKGRAGVLTAVAVAVLLAGGCGASGDRGSSGSAAKADAVAPAAPAAPAAPVNGGAPSAAAAATGGKAAPVADSRVMSYTAQLTVRAKDVNQALAKARELATAAGGYVGAESVTAPAGSVPSGQLQLKLPSAAFQSSLDQLAGLGEVLSRTSQAEDLTQQVADVSSRVQSQQASVERVRALMGQAKSLADVTTLEAELSKREADLESLQKQQKELASKTSYSTVTLNLRGEEPLPEPASKKEERKDEGFWSSVGSALSGGWDVLVLIVRGLAVAVAAVSPFLLALGVPALVAYRFLRRRRPTPVQPEEEQPE
ncbi:DUF4349 domain-containing protein [Streptomyces sp. NRRL WC-3742]|uniref:DUF4349 domain-containing protein n=1 Tax=Streptomyces sp. NRRL WC-3742 TaxID=1463934 RepID=UPI00131EA0AD|nr:DUF4349 domain-containing protein [Streptomyces sp. NRRL WC-3742]